MTSKPYIVTIAIFLSHLSGCAPLKYNGSTRMEEKNCTTSVHNAFYTGPYKGVENNLGIDDVNQDLYCANLFRMLKHPSGYVTIMGGSSFPEFEQNDPTKKNIIYNRIRNFAKRWTEVYGARLSIMTGGGPGIMEAGSRGAMEGGGPSIGYTTYYGLSRGTVTKKPDPNLAFQRYKQNNEEKDIISDGLIFSSIAIREYLMIMHSAAIIFAPGGSGTEWEIFQTIEKIKSQQLRPIPVIFIGNKDEHWGSFYKRVEDMARRKTIKDSTVITEHIMHIENPEDAFNFLAEKLKLD